MARKIITIKRENVKKTTAKEALENYLRRCRLKNLSDKTLKVYTNMNTEFVKFVGEDEPVEKMNEETVLNYIEHSREIGNSPVYINTKLHQVRAFVYYCIKEYKIPSFDFPMVRFDQENKEPYTNEEVRRLLKQPEDGGFVEWRCWMLANFFLGTGVRMGTAINIKISDINFEEKTIFIRHQKNRTQAYLPLSSSLQKALELYLSLWEHDEDSYLFPSSYEPEKPICETVCEQSMAKYHKERNVGKTGIHRYRHTFAKLYIVNGGDAMSLQRILQHSTMEMTKRYVKLYATDLQRNFDKFCALDQFQ